MTTRARTVDRAAHQFAGDVHRVRVELRAARRVAGLSCDAVGRSCGIDGSTVARIESGESRQPDLRSMARVAAAVGLELRLRTYIAGEPIRDAGQRRLLSRLRSRIAPGLRWQTEVPLPVEGDMRAWDAVIGGNGWSLGVEAETVLEDLQTVERRFNLKRRDGGLDRALLLIADTRRNRRGLSASNLFPDLDRDARRILRSLQVGQDPGNDGLVLM